MGSLFEIAKSGIQTYRQALSVTGQNIANVNTVVLIKYICRLEVVVRWADNYCLMSWSLSWTLADLLNICH